MDKVNYENLQREVYQAVMNRMDFNKDFSDREIMDLIDDVIVSVDVANDKIIINQLKGIFDDEDWYYDTLSWYV